MPKLTACPRDQEVPSLARQRLPQYPPAWAVFLTAAPNDEYVLQDSPAENS